MTAVPITPTIAVGDVAGGASGPRVLLAHAETLWTAAVHDVLVAAGVRVVAETSNGVDAVTLARAWTPDVVLLDVTLVGGTGASVLERIFAETGGRSRVVVLSATASHEVALGSLRRGAIGFLDREIDPAVLPRVVRDVAQGRAAVSRSLTTHLLEHLRQLPEGRVGMRPVHSPLTAREWEVADLLSRGQGTDQLAATLVLTTETVRTHIKNIMRKLDVHSRAELIKEIEHLRCGLAGGSEPVAQTMRGRSWSNGRGKP